MSSTASTWTRNQFTKIGKIVAGKGTPYWIHFNGVNTVANIFTYPLLSR